MAIYSYNIRAKLIQNRLLLIILLATILTGSFLMIDYIGIQMLSLVRVYVNGESAYSKAQKNAVIYLNRYMLLHQEEDYERYLQQISIPIADRNARIELEKENPDYELAQQWFIKGQNHPENVKLMTRFFKYLNYYKPTDNVIDAWRRGDQLLVQLNQHASLIHSLIQSGQYTEQELRREVHEILRLNEQLTLLQEEFSTKLGEIARRTEKVLFIVTLCISFFLLMLFTFAASRTMRSIRDSEDKYRTLFEEAISGIIICSPEGKLSDINPIGASLLGLYQYQDLSSYTIIDVFAKFREGESLHNLFQQEKHLENIEVEILQDNSVKRVALLNAITQYDEKRKVISYRIILQDITERKLSEQLLKEQYEELKKINAELDSFVYRASHDLRAPLSSILGLIEISRMEPKPEARAHYYELMCKSVNKLDNFIKNIISYSKNARLDVTFEQIDFGLLIEEVFDNLQYMEGVDKIEKKVTLHTDHPFYTDPFRLQIIFSNFISNAIKYSNNIDDAYLLVKVTTYETKAVIEFIDNGIGIASEDKDKIFNMFYRATGKNAGSGLGLYIVKEAMSFLKGTIDVVSEVGEGTHFTITLPNMNSKS